MTDAGTNKTKKTRRKRRARKTGAGTAVSHRTGPKALGPIIRQLTRDASKGRSDSAYATLLRHWPAIVGEDKARLCRPGKLNFSGRQANGATLTLQVSAAAATEIQHQTEWLIERINGFFGRPVIGALKLRQTHLTVKPPKAARPREDPDPEALARMDERLSAIESPELREALRGLGSAVLSASDRD